MIDSIYFLFGTGLLLFIIKKIMSIVQLMSAAEELAEMDIKERNEKEHLKGH